MTNVLFICSQNWLHSPTAEDIFADWPGIETSSAGLNHDAATPVDSEILQWADLIFVMEEAHRKKLAAKFQPHLRNRRVICLNIPNEFELMDERLIEILR